jgi:hypothetical protein
MREPNNLLWMVTTRSFLTKEIQIMKPAINDKRCVGSRFDLLSCH